MDVFCYPCSEDMTNNDHTQITLNILEPVQENVDIASAYLTSIGYVGFVEENNQLLAYIPVSEFDLETLNQLVSELSQKHIVELNFQMEQIEDKNWNEVWEQNYFQPIAIKDKLYVRGSFHPQAAHFEHEIIIDPKMSFGTGHHQTTKMILESLMEADLTGKSVMDMGTGTGILAIYAGQKGAGEIIAVDIDDRSVENAVENFELNNFGNKIQVYKGDARILSKLGKSYDIFIANINLGVLLDDAELYEQHLNSGGELFLSGFLQSDIDVLKKTVPLRWIDTKTDGDWAMLRFIKA